MSKTLAVIACICNGISVGLCLLSLVFLANLHSKNVPPYKSFNDANGELTRKIEATTILSGGLLAAVVAFTATATFQMFGANWRQLDVWHKANILTGLPSLVAFGAAWLSFL